MLTQMFILPKTALTMRDPLFSCHIEKSFEVIFACFFAINFLGKTFSRIPSECGTVWMGIRPDILLGLKIWPDLVPNCLLRLSADGTGRQIVKQSFLLCQKYWCRDHRTCLCFR